MSSRLEHSCRVPKGMCCSGFLLFLALLVPFKWQMTSWESPYMTWSVCSVKAPRRINMLFASEKIFGSWRDWNSLSFRAIHSQKLHTEISEPRQWLERVQLDLPYVVLVVLEQASRLHKECSKWVGYSGGITEVSGLSGNSLLFSYICQWWIVCVWARGSSKRLVYNPASLLLILHSFFDVCLKSLLTLQFNLRQTGLWLRRSRCKSRVGFWTSHINLPMPQLSSQKWNVLVLNKTLFPLHVFFL